MGYAAVSLLLAATMEASAAPALRVNFYAPVQHDSPVRIVGFAYDDSHLQFEFLNVSGKPIVAVDVEGLAFAPSGCSLNSLPYVGFGIGSYQIHLLPNERKLTALDAPHAYFLPFIVAASQRLETAYLKAQIRVFEVDFADGTKWGKEPQFPTGLESKLIAADRESCSDAEAVAETVQALRMVNKTRFRTITEDRTAVHGGETDDDVAQAQFSCSLDGQMAVCVPAK